MIKILDTCEKDMQNEISIQREYENREIPYERMKNKFEIICKKCGSRHITVEIDPNYGEPSPSIHCLDCDEEELQ